MSETGRIFVRQRRDAAEGTGRPRFAIVAVQGMDLKVFQSHVRRGELETIAAETGAQIVYLPRGEGEGPQSEGGGGRRRRRRPEA
ncbi:MAG: hypothetical protein PHY79_00190 [Anaerolineae bacterium]|jgi:hypothetical protein|nr:hypothetical protein [Anaerolineae bacterium]MDX9828826.1 hypothetical protein [Anaerolineae bacterium]